MLSRGLTTFPRCIAACAISVATLASALFAMPSPADALMQPMNDAALSLAARDVVVAEVVSTVARSDNESGIVTEVRLAVSAHMAGSLPDDVVLAVPGGSLGDKTLWVSGAPSFHRGERVVVFLDARRRVVGGYQGVLRVRDERIERTGEPLQLFEHRVRLARQGFPVVSPPPVQTFETSPVAALTGTSPEATGDVEGTASSAGGPMISSISPAQAPAGAGALITITGTGFGDTRGEVYFYYAASTYLPATNVVSWSDGSILVEVPGSISSGPVLVWSAAQGSSPGFHLDVPYSLGPAAWPNATVPFKVSSNVSSTRRTQVERGASAWNGSSGLLFAADGTTSAPRGENAVNEVWWGTTSFSGALAEARVWFYRRDSNGDGRYDICEADVIFSDSVSNWGDGSPGTFDVQSVAAHEFGHWLALGDLYGEADAPKVMYGMSKSGTTKRVLAEGDRAGIVALYGPPSAPIMPMSLTRIAGPDRYATALEISRATYEAGQADTVVLAVGHDFPDALSASGLAGAYRSPLLLTPRDTLRTDTLSELVRLGAKRAVLVGGPGAISEQVELSLQRSGLLTTRIAGEDRYGTAAEVAREIADLQGSAFKREAFMVRGDGFADALAAAPVAYARRAPVLLVRPSQLPDATARAIDDIRISSATVVGGENAVSSAVTDALTGSDVAWTRVAGPDRYATARAFADHAVSKGWASCSRVGVATGLVFPDALGGGAATGAGGGVLLLTRPDVLVTDTRSMLLINRNRIESIAVFGGEAAISNGVYDSIRELCAVP